MPIMTPTDHADTEGPNASLQFGDATRMSSLQRETGQLATGPAGPPAMQLGASSGGGPASAGPPAQPTPAQGQQMTPERVRNEVFSPPAQSRRPWRDEFRAMAAHPDAHYLRALADLAEGK
jgi:hypothetical protein